MRSKVLAFFLMTITAFCCLYANAFASDGHQDITRKLLVRKALPNVSGHMLAALTVNLSPGALAPPHQHEAFAFVYVLEGNVRSQLGDEAPVDYVIGESWVEPPSVAHTLTQNLSETKSAKLLVVFVSKTGSRLTTSGAIDH